MRHPRYFLINHPGISCNTTNATHFSTPPTSPTLALHPLYPHCRTTTSPTLACHPRQHTTNTKTPPVLAGLPPRHATYDTHSSTNSMPFLRLLRIQLKPLQEIQQFLLLVFIFTVFTFLGLLKHFDRSLENCHRKIQRTLVCVIQKELFYQKQMRIFFRKSCFLILVSFWPFYIF